MRRDEKEKMPGLVMPGSRVSEIKPFAVPHPGPGEVRLRVKAAGLCGSDIHFYRNPPEENRAVRGVVVGHEPSGIVDELGEGVTLFREGDRITVNPALGCGHCEYCLNGHTLLCPEYIGMAADGRGGDTRFVVMPERNCRLLPQDLSFIDGTFLACTGATAYAALRKLEARGGLIVAVYGLGPVGLATVLLSKAFGARTIGVDLNADRLDMARFLGADEVINAGKVEPVASLLSVTGGRGAELGVETSGVAAAQSNIVDSVSTRGKVVFVGLGGGEKSISPEAFIHKEVQLFGSKIIATSLIPELIRFLREKAIHFEAVVTTKRPLEEGPEAVRDFDGGAAGKFVFLP